MGLWNSVKNLFRKGGAAMGLVNSLVSITDHPKINVPASEYKRIERDLVYFKGEFDDITERNTEGDEFKRPYVSLNMSQVVARRLASLLYNEQSKISVDESAADTFVKSVLDANDFGKNFERYLESGVALGGLAIRPYVDSATGAIKLAWIQAPNFFPLKSNTNDISDAAIATPSQRVEGSRTVYYTLLEFHEWSPSGYTVTNELYRSDVAGQVGVKVPLSMVYPDMLEEANLDTSLFTRPLFTYFKPAGFNNRNLVSPLGVGVCDNALNTLKQINDTYDQFNWEVKMGQRRVAVPSSMIEVQYGRDGKKAPKQVFDPKQNVYLAVGGGMDDTKVTDLTTAIRANDYISSMNQFLKTLEMQVGLSAGTFAFDGQGLKTATEVVSENSMTYQTRNSHLTMVERTIKELVISICELAAGTTWNGHQLYTGQVPTVDEITVDFDDGVFTDKSATADYWIKLQAAGAIPTWMMTQRVLGVTEDEAKEIAAEVAGDTAASAQTQSGPEGLFGGDG